MGSKCLRAWGLSSKTWGLSDLDPYLIANCNQIREFLKLGSKYIWTKSQHSVFVSVKSADKYYTVVYILIIVHVVS